MKMKIKIKIKINKEDPIKHKIFCTAKETIQNLKTTYQMRESVYKWSNWQEINLQNIQTTHAALMKKQTQTINQKMGSKPIIMEKIKTIKLKKLI